MFGEKQNLKALERAPQGTLAFQVLPIYIKVLSTYKVFVG